LAGGKSVLSADSSLEAYFDVKKYGQDLTRQEQILGLMQATPWKDDWTNRELANALNLDTCEVVPRVRELRESGLLEFSRKRLCGVTYRRVRAWRLTETR